MTQDYEGPKTPIACIDHKATMNKVDGTAIIIKKTFRFVLVGALSLPQIPRRTAGASNKIDAIRMASKDCAETQRNPATAQSPIATSDMVTGRGLRILKQSMRMRTFKTAKMM